MNLVHSERGRICQGVGDTPGAVEAETQHTPAELDELGSFYSVCPYYNLGNSLSALQVGPTFCSNV